MQSSDIVKPITLITPTQGNPVALVRTINSFAPYINEVVIGDVCVFKEDKTTIKEMAHVFSMKGLPVRILPLPFNYIFLHGFAHTLNVLADYATNDFILYMNVGEVIHSGRPVVSGDMDFNSFFITHPIEKHLWFRMYNKKEMKWSGFIHEEIVGQSKRCPTSSFVFEDTEKDMNDPYKAGIYNHIKEIVYFKNYLRLIDVPGEIGATNRGWVNFAAEQYGNMKERMEAKGMLYTAFLAGDSNMLSSAISLIPGHEENSVPGMNFQGKRYDVL